MSKIQALIIGGTTGMGKATAKLLLQKGIEVTIVGRSDKNLDKTKSELAAFGEVKIKGVNLFNIDEVEEFANSLQNEMPNLKHLVNAAGYFSPKSFLEHRQCPTGAIPAG